MNLQKQKILLIGLVLIGLFFVPYLSFARGLVPCGGDGEDVCKLADVFVGIARVTNWLLMVAGVYASYKIIQAGFSMVISMGNEESITKSKKQIENAVLGFVFTMMSFMFVYTTVNILLRGAGDSDPNKCNIDIRDPLSFLITTDNCSKK